MRRCIGTTDVEVSRFGWLRRLPYGVGRIAAVSRVVDDRAPSRLGYYTEGYEQPSSGGAVRS